MVGDFAEEAFGNEKDGTAGNVASDGATRIENRFDYSLMASEENGDAGEAGKYPIIDRVKSAGDGADWFGDFPGKSGAFYFFKIGIDFAKQVSVCLIKPT